jgi:hypothetical protein
MNGKLIMKQTVKTIKINEFKNLKLSKDDPQRYCNSKVGDKFVWGAIHKKQCKNLKVGNKVFYLEVTGIHKNPPQIDITIKQSILIR